MNAALFPDVVVNGEAVPHGLVAAETQNQNAPAGKPGLAWRKAAKAIAIRTLLLQEARSRGLEAEAQEVGPGRFETEEEALIRGLLEQAVVVSAPSETDIRAEWEKDPSRFRTSPLWEVSHILCACDPRDHAAREKAKARAEGILMLALGAPKEFPALAGRESDCGSKASGGALGQLGPNDTVPEFEAALRQLAEGVIAPEPVLTRHGYHIIRMDAVAVGQVLPFKAVQPKIVEAMEKAAWVKASHDFITQLVEASIIEGADMNVV